MEYPIETAIEEIMVIIQRTIQTPVDEQVVPQSSEQHIMGLESCIQAYRGIISVVDMRVKLEVRKLAQHRNALVPIHRLPEELISSLFNTVVHLPCWQHLPGLQHPEETALDRVRRLTSVCAAWMRIALNTASLWTTLDLADPEPMVSKALILSRESLLDWTSTRARLHRPDQRTNILALAKPHRYRWRSFYFGTASIHTYMSIVTERASKTIETFIVHRLDNTTPQPITPPFNLFAGKAPNLKHLEICFPILWDSRIFSGLKSLCLTSIDHHGPSAAEMRSLLAGCPCLKNLKLWEVTMAPDVTQLAIQSRDAILLPHLQSLHLGLSPDDTRVMLALLRTPSSLDSFTLHLQEKRGGTSLTTWTFDTVTPFLATFSQEYDDWIDRIKIQVDRYGVEISVTTRTETTDLRRDKTNQSFSIKSGTSLSTATIVWALKGVSEALRVNWELTVDVDDVEPTVLAALENESRITAIDFNLTRNNPLYFLRNFLKYLAEPTVQGGLWPFPMLARLRVNRGVRCGEAVRSMLEKRYGRGAMGEGLPRRLEFLHVDNMYQETEGDLDCKTCKQIRAIMEGVEVLMAHPIMKHGESEDCDC